MYKELLDKWSQLIIAGSFLSFGGIKLFKFILPFIKNFFTKSPKQTNQVTVNVGKQPTLIFAGEKEDYRSFLYFLLEQGKILRAMHDMRSDILKEQMDYFNKFIQNIKNSITEIMIELLKEAGLEDFHYVTYFSNFENFIEVCEGKVQLIFRKMCKDNHFSEYSQFEYRELIDKNVRIIEGNLNELLRKRYPQKEFIKNFDRIYESQKTLYIGLKDCFEYARDIAIERETKVKNAKESFEIQVSEIIGMKYSLEI